MAVWRIYHRLSYIKEIDTVKIELLEEYKYVDAICRDMLGAEKGVSAYIEQLDETPMTARYWITEWNDEYRQLKYIRWLRNQIAHALIIIPS